MTSNTQVRLANEPSDFDRLGLSDTVASWEDSARTDDRKGTYEWWYFDADLTDGAKLVVIFMNKLLTEVDHPLEPLLRFDLEFANGEKYSVLDSFPADAWNAKTGELDVRIGSNRFWGTLDQINIHTDVAGVVADVTMTPLVKPWRPATGHFSFENPTEEGLFAWLPSMPVGAVKARVRIDDRELELEGTGYHEHQWSDVALIDIIHDWYWARGRAGSFSTITFFITAHEQYGAESFPIFYLTKDGEVVGDDPSKVQFEVEDVYDDEFTGKPIANVIRYRYDGGADQYTVEFARRKDITSRRMLDDLSPEKRPAAEVAGFDGAYLRFTGTLTIEHTRDGEVVERAQNEAAIWELMYFGHARELAV